MCNDRLNGNLAKLISRWVDYLVLKLNFNEDAKDHPQQLSMNIG